MKKTISILVLACAVFALWYFLSDAPGNDSRVVYVNSSADLIRVEGPLPDDSLGKTFTVEGEARGFWFFENSFPVEVLDANGVVIGRGLGASREEWMTENFIPFTAPVEIVGEYTGQATLVLKKDNPSGDPDRDASVSFVVSIY